MDKAVLKKKWSALLLKFAMTLIVVKETSMQSDAVWRWKIRTDLDFDVQHEVLVARDPTPEITKHVGVLVISLFCSQR